MNDDTVDAYDQLDAALSLADISVLPAEAHGIIVGALCNHLHTGNRPDLMALILDRPAEDSAPIVELGELCYSIYRSTMEVMLDGEGDFALQLPHESDSLEFRTESLGAWCRGYLLGLLHDDTVDIGKIGGDSEEIIEDIMTISEAAPGDQDPEQEDWAFAEIEEYLRVGVQLVFETIYEQRAAAAPPVEQ